jgi:hypothetical protein
MEFSSLLLLRSVAELQPSGGALMHGADVTALNRSE